MNSKWFTCFICEDNFEVYKWEDLKYCKCGSTGVDYEPLFTRYVGLPAKDSESFQQTYDKKKELIDKFKRAYEENGVLPNLYHL